VEISVKPNLSTITFSFVILVYSFSIFILILFSPYGIILLQMQQILNRKWQGYE